MNFSDTFFLNKILLCYAFAPRKTKSTGGPVLLFHALRTLNYSLEKLAFKALK